MKIPKLKPKAFIIEPVIYPGLIYVCFLDLSKLKELMLSCPYTGLTEYQLSNKLKDLYELDESFGVTYRLNNGSIIIYITHNYKTNREHMFNTITHEVLHATQMMLDGVGLQLCSKTDEAYCYLNGYINQQIFKQI